jgi:hypothetical protein
MGGRRSPGNDRIEVRLSKPRNSKKKRLSKPRNSKKKWRIEVIDTGQVVQFGQAGAEDFTKHKDPERMIKYLNRHAGNVPAFLKRPGLTSREIIDKALSVQTSRRENWGAGGIGTAGFWSRWLLWSYPTMTEAKAFLKRRFNIVFR